MSAWPISTIIFDMDGVLIDSEPIHLQIEQQQFRDLGLVLSPAEHLRYVGTSANNMWQQLNERYHLQTSVADRVAEGSARFLAHLRQHRAEVRPVAGVSELIAKLLALGKQLVLASSAPRQNIELVLEVLGLAACFPVRVSGQELPLSKPHPEIFLRAAQLAGATPAQCTVIEDAANGVAAAKAAGMRCLAYRNPHSGPQDLAQADRIVDRLGPELADWLLMTEGLANARLK
jgi:beta-phosphoglucomutase-like phosphatase (HAD superfamily)